MVDLVALLRGINVGGVRVPMAELRGLLEDLALTDVRTVLASGNVRFRSDETDLARLEAHLGKAIGGHFGYDAHLLLRTVDEVALAVERFPFPEVNDRQPWVVFVRDPATAAELLSVSDALDPRLERVAEGSGVVYWDVPKGGTTSSAFSDHLGRSRFRTSTTNRNLRTLRKVLTA